MRACLVYLLSCAPVLGADSGIHVFTTAMTNMTNAGERIGTKETYTRDGQTNLVRETHTVAGVVESRVHWFYQAGSLVGGFVAMSHSSTFFSEAGTSHPVSLDYDAFGTPMSVVIGTPNGGVVVDVFSYTNGIFSPVERSVLEEANAPHEILKRLFENTNAIPATPSTTNPSMPAVTNEALISNPPRFRACCQHAAQNGVRLWWGPVRDSFAKAAEDARNHGEEWHEAESDAGVVDWPAGSETRNITYNNHSQTISPLTYVDEKSGLIYRVESDGRHVSASTGDGRQLWRRNPFVDAQMELYRWSKPIIRAIGTARDLGYTGNPDTIWIEFSSSQIGYIDPGTGDFHYVLRN